jgi:hypothetical protein
MTGSVVIAFLKIGPAPTTAWLIPPLLCAITAFVFAVIWPQESWRWGVCLSSGFFVFFMSVFLDYLSAGKIDSQSLLHATAVILAGVIAALTASALRRGNNEWHAKEG